MSDNEKEVCKNGCTNCVCVNVEVTEDAVEKAIARRQRLEEVCAPGGVGEYLAANQERIELASTCQEDGNVFSKMAADFDGAEVRNPKIH